MDFIALLATLLEFLMFVVVSTVLLLLAHTALIDLSWRRHLWGLKAKGIKLKNKSLDPAGAPGNRTVIRTARGENEINQGARSGYRPLVKRVVPSKRIFSTVTVFQNAKNGEIKCGSFRSTERMRQDGYEPIVSYRYYPHQFSEAVAAYLIPDNLSVGESVWLEDIIEDIVSLQGPGHQGRLTSWSAIWDGSEFVVMFNPRIHVTSFEG
jgi:hypothetical protein